MLTIASVLTGFHNNLNSLTSADKSLAICIKAWFLFALVGQLFFAMYIAIRYGIPLYTGNLEHINLSTHVTGFVEGDFSGNSMLFMHVIAASLLSFCGMLQLPPNLRQRFPAMHRINGRLFLTLGLAGALTGLYLGWLRGSRFSDVGAMGITLNGILIIVAGYFAWRYAIAGNIKLHQRWAVHAFFLINGVWTLRLMMMGWFIMTGGYGSSENLDGPADMFFSFACYLLPMILAELYFWAKKHNSLNIKWLTVVLLSSGCVLTLFGVLAAIYMLWIPSIKTAILAG